MTNTGDNDKRSLSPSTSSLNMLGSIQFATPLKEISRESAQEKHAYRVTTVTPEASVANHDSVGDDFDLGFLYENISPEDTGSEENKFLDTFGNCKGSIACFPLNKSGSISLALDRERKMKKRKHEYSSPVTSTDLSTKFLPSRPARNRSSSDIAYSRKIFSLQDQSNTDLPVLPPMIVRQDDMVPWKPKRRRLNMPMDDMLQTLSIQDQVFDKLSV